MKSIFVFALILVTVAGVWLFAGGTDSVHRGPHGGDLKEADNYWIELKSSRNGVYTWLLDQHKIGINANLADCHAVLVYDDTTKRNVEMIPYGIDGFYGEISNDHYASCVVVYTVKGDTVSAEFENSQRIVAGENTQKKKLTAAEATIE